MYAVGRIISQGVGTFSAPFHPFGGAVDIIVVKQPDGSFKSSPWYVKFGKFQGVLKTREKIVSIGVNGVEADFHMYLDHKGEAYFLREVEGEEIDSTIFSPSSSSDEKDDPSQIGKTGIENSIDVTQADLESSIEFENRKIMVRTSSRRSRILGLMFGGKSVKEKNREEDEGDVALARFSSIERAEIAADLLEVKWSTNLPTDIQRRHAKEPDEDSQANDDQDVASLLIHDRVEDNFNHSFVQEAIDPYNGETGNGTVSGIEDTDYSNGASSLARSLSFEEQDINTSVSGMSVLDGKFDVTPETLGNATLDSKEESEFVTSVPFLQNSHLGKQEGDETVSCLAAGVPNEESENSYICSEASNNSGVGVSSNGDELETVTLSQGECKEAQVRADAICETERLIPEVNLQLECVALMHKDNTNDTKVPSNEDSDTFPNNMAPFQCEESSLKEDTKSAVLHSNSSLDMHLVTSVSGGAEVLEHIYQESVTEKLSGGSSLQTDVVEAFENRPQVNGFFDPCVTRSIELNLEEPSKESASSAPIGSDDLVHLAEAEAQGVCFSSTSKSNSQVHEEEDLEKEEDLNSHHNASKFVDDPQRSSTEYFFTKRGHLSNLLLGSSEEDQFLFGDIDDSVASAVPCNYAAFADSVDIENNPLVTMKDNEYVSGSSNMAHASLLLEELTPKSSPMSIPRSRKSAGEEVEWTIGSLPNFRSHSDNLEMADVLHPLSHSLDSHSETLRQELLWKDVSSSTTSDLETVHQLAEDDPTVVDKRIWEEFKNISTNSAVEISLCKHLLYEGMGADAASQAFDAHKIDLEKCASLGPRLMKNDDLTVRIGGRYFPWDAATSFILEMLSLGHDKIVEPEGMIAVNRVEKTNEDQEPSRTNVPLGGNWTLWPFSLRRSRTINPVQPVPIGTKDSDVVNSSKSFSKATGDESLHIAKVAKKKVKSIVPTSEQLKMLNLNEGRNVITFTFSTAMLGQQQVDARIYLWKYNTRIVVSDVDGTITRSDVLGQFMPLVGKDWSHIGVTHLFSAIKENGYQLLFLSARAISQAYLTRQFLVNLKQDGKALPDGPVVISPDGLFPSLFREVIRRAPHEFKIACLKDIRALFPPDCSPFYAGFGNRITDEISYCKLGIPKGKIFIINAKGDVAVNRRFDRKSYTSLHALVDGMFPATTSAEQEDFNSYNYWRMPLPDITS